MKTRAPLVLLFVWLLALAAAAPLQIPYRPPAHELSGGGSAALWQGRAAPWFVIHTRSDPITRTATVLRSSFAAGDAWRASTQWDAAQLLAASEPAERRIFTLHGEPGAAPSTIAFLWPDMPASLRAMLDINGDGEARTTELRSQALGDILRSVPLIVGPPLARNFPERHARREIAVYVAASDGMLHAFSATSGRELFAYIPRLLHPALPAIGASGYHPRAWVDGSPAARDILTGEQWRTVLASGLGMGARGLFALDVTDPASFGPNAGALWEFGADDDSAMGHIHAPPALAQLAGSGSVPWAGREVAIVASGINPQQERAPGALFLLAIDKVAGQPGQRDFNYVRIDTGSSGNSLSPPALVIGPDGTAIHAYAGDLDGNLWHFDLAAQRSRLVFTARDAAGHAQSIAHAPQFVHAPGGGFLVVFGTGRLLEADDVLPASFRHQSLYGIHDVPGSGRPVIRSRSELAERILSGGSSYTISGPALDYFLPQARRGWFFDLPNGRSAGERAAASPVAEGGVLVFRSVAPGAAAGQAIRHYYINALDGTAVDPVASARRDKRTGEVSRAEPLQPLILIRGSTTESARSPTGGVTTNHRIQLVPTGPADGVPQIPVSQQVGRLGWREISNWQDLHAAARKRGG